MSGLVKGFKGLVVATGMELNASSASIEVGTTYQLTPTFTPSNPTNNKIYWTSSNTSVATVDDKGLVTPVSPGSTTITAVADYGGYTDTCNCQIFKINVTGVSLNKSSIILGEGETFQLEATITPSNASLKGLIWTSSNTNYATVDSNGLVTYVAPGDCTITVTTVDGGYTATCSCSSRIRVTGLELNSTSINVKAGETFQLEATITPNNATLKTVTWNSSNTSVATVSQNGLVTYVGDGNCTITCTSNDNNEIYDTCSVVCSSKAKIRFLLIGGGGSGSYYYSAGGGAGGVIQCSEYEINKGSYSVVIGTGGVSTSNTYCNGSNGGNSSFNGLIAYGGGYGGGETQPGGAGGSGGGGGHYCGRSYVQAGGAGCSGQGYVGGSGYCRAGGGGGGAGGAGCNYTSYCLPGMGGPGIQSNISGTNQWYAGGGSGQSGYNCFCRANCGGTPSCTTNASNATICGAGGGGTTNVSYGRGGNGLFIVSYPSSCGYNITGGTKYLCNGNCIHCFTGNGTLIIS